MNNTDAALSITILKIKEYHDLNRQMISNELSYDDGQRRFTLHTELLGIDLLGCLLSKIDSLVKDNEELSLEVVAWRNNGSVVRAIPDNLLELKTEDKN